MRPGRRHLQLQATARVSTGSCVLPIGGCPTAIAFVAPMCQGASWCGSSWRVLLDFLIVEE